MLTLDKNTLYHVWPDDYEEEDENGEMVDNSDWAWSDFCININYLLNPFIDYYLNSKDKEYENFFEKGDKYPLRVEGKHMGWMKRDGYKDVLVRRFASKLSSDLFQEILPGGGDCTIKVYSNENYSEIEFIVGHHDGNDHYILQPGSWEDFR